MLACCTTATLQGLDAIPVAVEVDLSPGLPSVQMVGLADTAIHESRERLRSALRNSGLNVPLTRIVVSLAPADLRKVGPGFDLPIALALLAASGQLKPEALQDLWCAAELGLNGQLRPIRGVLPLAIAAQRAGAKALLVADANHAEAALVQGLEVWSAATLQGSLELLHTVRRRGCGSRTHPPLARSQRQPQSSGAELDLADVEGQEHGRRALEIAAAGEHHLLLVGPPGSGKTMLAQRLAGLLPPLRRSEALTITQIQSVAGLLQGPARLVERRPFRCPHHSCSVAALIGGGSNPKPGELSLAHHGVLFLDELTEFPRRVLDQLRQPLEAGEIWIQRARLQSRFPCRITLIAATNPCPCGWHGHSEPRCTCPESARRRYWATLSGPLLDRLDLQVVVNRSATEHLRQPYERKWDGAVVRRPEPTAVVAARVAQARERMSARNPEGMSNGCLSPAQFRELVRIESAALNLWETALQQRCLSGRCAERLMRVAQTITDLSGGCKINTSAMAEALSYRSYDLNQRPAISGGDGAAALCACISQSESRDDGDA